MAAGNREWMKSVGFKDETIDRLLADPEFAAVAPELEKGYLRQSDYSKSMNDLKTAQTALATENEKLTNDMAEWANLTAAEKAKSGDLRKAIDDGQAEIFRLKTTLARLAEDNGIDPKTVLGDQPVVPPKKDEPPVVNLDEVRGQIGSVAAYNMRLSAALPRIAREHQALTGESFDEMAFIDEIQADLAKGKTDNLDPIKRWESKYGIAAKRSEQQATARKAELDAAREEGRTAGLSEAALPNTQPRTGKHSPVLRLNPNGENKGGRPNPMDRMSGARAALATGKYRSKTA